MKKQLRVLYLILTVTALALLTVLSISATGNYQVGGSSYETLAEAVAAVPQGGTIHLMGNTVENEIVVLDVNKTYTVDGGSYAISFGGSRGLSIKSGTVNLTKGTLRATNPACYIVYVEGTSTVNINGTRFVGGTAQLNVTNRSGATVNISGNTEFGAKGVSVSRALINSNNGAFHATSLKPTKSYDTVNIMGGSFQGYTTFSHGLINAAGANINISGGSFTMPANTAKPLIRMTDGDHVSAVKISGGNFTTNGTGSIVDYDAGVSGGYATETKDRPAGALTVTGGTFTMLGNGKGLNCISTKNLDQLPTVAISGGTFKGGDIQLAVGGTVALSISGDAVFGADFSGSRLISFFNSADVISNKTRSARVTITSGSFAVYGKKVMSGEDEVTKGAVMFHCAGGELVISGGTFVLHRADTARDLSQVIFQLTDNDVNSNVTVTGGTFVTSDSTAAIFHHAASAFVKRDGGAYGRQGAGNITVSGTPVFDATAGGRIFNLRTAKSYPYTVSISGGTFKGAGDCLIWCSSPCGKLNISGGVFHLLEGSTVTGGAILRTGADLYQHYSPIDDYTELYHTFGGEIAISGGVFVDDRAHNNQVMDLSIGNGSFSIKNSVMLSAALKSCFVLSGEQEDVIGMSTESPRIWYGGKQYYTEISLEATLASRAPVLVGAPTLRTVKDSQGIRFTSAISAAAVEAIFGSAEVTLGTLIAPADHVAEAGGFTHAALSAYAMAVGIEQDRIFADVVAKNSLVPQDGGGYTFNAALINIKPTNRHRPFLAVSYAKVGNTYYYSACEATEQAGRYDRLCESALADVGSAPDATYTERSLYWQGSYSPYPSEVQQMMQSICGYAVPTEVTVTPSEYRIVCGNDATVRVLSAVNDLRAVYGITVLNGTKTEKEILVGNTAREETKQALSKIKGHGYYIGVIGSKLVIVGTTNALTEKALDCFTATYAGTTFTVRESVISDLPMYVINSDTVFVFSRYRDGAVDRKNEGGYLHSSYYDASGYRGEDNSELQVDYPAYAASVLRRLFTGADDRFFAISDDHTVAGLTIHIGITSDPDTAALLRRLGSDVNAFGYVIKDGKIVIASYNDQSLRKAVALFTNDLEELAVRDGGGNVTGYLLPFDYEAVRTATDTSSFLTDFPTPTLQLSGALDIANGAYQYYYADEGVNVGAFLAYCEQLRVAGYMLYMQNDDVEGSYFRTYVNGSKTQLIHVAYQAFAHAASERFSEGQPLSDLYAPAITVSVAEIDGTHINLIPESMLTLGSYERVTDTAVTSMQLHPQNIGHCYIITLEDGSFIVLDGGDGSTVVDDTGRLYNVLAELHERAHGSAPTEDDPIVIAAWYLSHSHGDHHNNFIKLLDRYRSRIVVEQMIASYPSNDELYNCGNPNPAIGYRIGTDKWLRDKNGYVKYVKVFTGQKFFVRNVEFEVLYTHGDMYPWSIETFNDVTTVIRFTMYHTDGKGHVTEGSVPITAMWLGDAQRRVSMWMRAMYGEYLSSDMVQVAHHGGTGCEFELYDLIDAQCVWWTTVYTSFRSEIDPSKTGKNALITNAQVNDDCWDIIILSDGYNVMMTLRPDGADLDRLENIADDDAAMEYGQYIIRPEDIPSIRATL